MKKLDEEIKDFLKKRGGICFAGSKRYAKANNKYMKNYDKNIGRAKNMKKTLRGLRPRLNHLQSPPKKIARPSAA